jgi:hypothetical protein
MAFLYFPAMVLSSSPIEVQGVGNNVTYVFPTRPLGKWRWVGFLSMLFGILFVASPLSWWSRSLFILLQGKGGVGEVITVAFLSVFCWFGLMPFWIGLFIVCGRCRVEWRDGRLSTTEVAGPIRWRRKFQKTALRKISVIKGNPKTNGQPMKGAVPGFGAIGVEFEKGKNRLLALGYPGEWLEALAKDLSERVAVPWNHTAPPVVEVIDRQNNFEMSDVAQKPASSQIRIEPQGNGMHLIIPPAGLWKGSKGMMTFAILWCGFMAVFTTMVFLIPSKSKDAWIAGPFVAAFWAIGIGLLTAAVNMGKRRAIFVVENQNLRLAQKNLFGTKTWNWAPGEISAIGVGPSGMEVNHVPVIELQIHPLNGKKAGFFAGRNEEELRWLATELRRGVNVPAR